MSRIFLFTINSVFYRIKNLCLQFVTTKSKNNRLQMLFVYYLSLYLYIINK